MRVVIAPDSFKGSAVADRVAHAIAEGWLAARPGDLVHLLPLADGGEGTLDALESAAPGTRRRWVTVDGPRGRLNAPWLLLDDGTAVVELAAACGMPLWGGPCPLTAHTYALGQVIAAAVRDPMVNRLFVSLGGSASTDGGTGALRALGARFLAADGREVPLGGAALSEIAHVDVTGMAPAPERGIFLLTDVDAPLLGASGAAAQFGPQKGARPWDVQVLETGLQRLAAALGGDPQAPGAGAAGGTAYGLTAVWGARCMPGSTTVADVLQLQHRIWRADLVITGEGRLDLQSYRGKVVGHVVQLARQQSVPVWAVVGQADPGAAEPIDQCVVLAEVAGSALEATREPERWIRLAGHHLAVHATAHGLPGAAPRPSAHRSGHRSGHRS